MIKPLLKKAAKGGKPLVVITISKAKAKVIGIAFFKPPIKRISRVPRACMMPPARRNHKPSKNAWLIMWNKLPNQPTAPADDAVPSAAIIKPSWLIVE